MQLSVFVPTPLMSELQFALTVTATMLSGTTKTTCAAICVDFEERILSGRVSCLLSGIETVRVTRIG
ncbi:MAG: hypothetical protein JRF07_06550 [Deltaproteobacteria bacterium]|jgi:hypothetical protein|nr:hypothetical protein [Deltaproteobacteria bacterium]